MKILQESFSNLFHRNEDYLVILILFALSILVFIPLAPNIKFLDRDGSIFLFIGRSILDGKIPYRDLWDHKGPILYFINALSQIISDRSVWGLWVIEIMNLFLCQILIWKISKKIFSKTLAVILSIIFLSGFKVFIQGGNFTEEFSLLPLLLSLYIVSKDNDGFSKRKLFLHGIFFGIVFFLRPNNIGLFISLSVLIFVKIIQKKKSFLEITPFVFGLISLTFLIVLYFWYHKAIVDFVDQLFMRNFFYSVSIMTPKKRIENLFFAVNEYAFLLFPAIIGWANCLRKCFKQPCTTLRFIFVIDLPLELFLLSLSGRFFPHYFLCTLPASVFLIGDLLNDMIKNISKICFMHPNISLGFISVILLLPVWQNVIYVRPFARELFKYGWKVKTNELIEYIKNNSKITDTILVWGHEPMIYLYADRFTPTKYLYQQAFETPNYFKTEMLNNFCDDISDFPPKYIIDTRNPFPLAQSKRSSVNNLQFIKYHCLFSIIDKNYILQKQIDQNYDIFMFK